MAVVLAAPVAALEDKKAEDGAAQPPVKKMKKKKKKGTHCFCGAERTLKIRSAFCTPHWDVVKIGRTLKSVDFEGANKAFQNDWWEEKIARECQPTKESVLENMWGIYDCFDEQQKVPLEGDEVPLQKEAEEVPLQALPPTQRNGRSRKGIELLQGPFLPSNWKTDDGCCWDEERHGLKPAQLRKREELSEREKMMVADIEAEIEASAESLEAAVSELRKHLFNLFADRYLLLSTPRVVL